MCCKTTQDWRREILSLWNLIDSDKWIDRKKRQYRIGSAISICCGSNNSRCYKIANREGAGSDGAVEAPVRRRCVECCGLGDGNHLVGGRLGQCGARCCGSRLHPID